jgi:hypothetical protein
LEACSLVERPDDNSSVNVWRGFVAYYFSEGRLKPDRL